MSSDNDIYKIWLRIGGLESQLQLKYLYTNKIKLPTLVLWNSREGINIKNISLVPIHKKRFQPYGANQLNVNISILNPTGNESHLF